MTNMNIPDRCVGCPMNTMNLDAIKESSARLVPDRAELDEESDANLSRLHNVLKVLGKHEDLLAFVQEDAVNIRSIFEIAPNSAKLTVPEFLRDYRGKGSTLGDTAFGIVLNHIAPDNLIIHEMPADVALDIAIRATEALVKRFNEESIVDQDGIDETIKSYDIGSASVERGYVELDALEAGIKEKIEQMIQNRVSACEDGVKEKQKGIFSKRTIRYCGSRAILQTYS